MKLLISIALLVPLFGCAGSGSGLDARLMQPGDTLLIRSAEPRFDKNIPGHRRGQVIAEHGREAGPVASQAQVIR